MMKNSLRFMAIGFLILTVMSFVFQRIDRSEGLMEQINMPTIGLVFGLLTVFTALIETRLAEIEKKLEDKLKKGK